jgi:hypothetical protein
VAWRRPNSGPAASCLCSGSTADGAARRLRPPAPAPHGAAPLAGDRVVGQHLVGDREPGLAAHQAARQREQFVLLALEAAAQGRDAALDGAWKLSRSTPRRRRRRRPRRPPASRPRPADLLEIAQQAVGGFGTAAQGRHQELVQLARMAIVHHLAQSGAQLGRLAGGQGAVLVRKSVQLARQRLQRRTDGGLFHGQGNEGVSRRQHSVSAQFFRQHKVQPDLHGRGGNLDGRRMF